MESPGESIPSSTKADATETKPAYDTLPLEKEEITVAAVQMNPESIDPKHPEAGIRKNMERMLYLCDASTVCFPIGKKDLLVFPEFIPNGFDTNRTREDWLRIAIMVPGPETELIGKKAKEIGSYIVFGSHIQDKEWPGHFFNCSVMVSPEGKVVQTHWKAYAGFAGMGLEYATTVYDVLDEFVERYGWEAVWPVARTPIGNIASYVCSEGFSPETARMFAYNGAEILCRHFDAAGFGVPGGKLMLLFRADCAFNDVYGVATNGGSGLTFGGQGLPKINRGGASMIISPLGAIMNQVEDTEEQIIVETIPVAAFRKKHVLPFLRTELYIPWYERHKSQFPPNTYSRYLPTDLDDARRWTLENARW